MSCIDKPRAPAALPPVAPSSPRGVAGSGLVLLMALAGCSHPPSSAPAQGGAPAVSTAPSPAKPAGASPAPASGKGAGGASVSLGPPKTPRSHAELRRQAAQRLVAANPDRSYMGTVPDVLLAIPVLEVELTGEGQVLSLIHI